MHCPASDVTFCQITLALVVVLSLTVLVSEVLVYSSSLSFPVLLHYFCSLFWHTIFAQAGSRHNYNPGCSGRLPFHLFVKFIVWLSRPLLCETLHGIGVLVQSEDLFTLIETHEAKPLKLYVYNTDLDACREVTITPNSAWGGEGRWEKSLVDWVIRQTVFECKWKSLISANLW